MYVIKSSNLLNRSLTCISKKVKMFAFKLEFKKRTELLTELVCESSKWLQA